MSESLVGVNVAATRQNAGSFAYAPLVPALVPGGTNAPGSTTPEKVIRAFVNVSDDSGSHAAAGVDPSRRGSVRPTTPAIQRTTAAKVTHRIEFRMVVLAQRERRKASVGVNSTIGGCGRRDALSASCWSPCGRFSAPPCARRTCG